MQSLKSYLFVMGCILASLCSHAWADEPAITFGQLVTGTISSAGQVNRYTLTASAGDIADFTMDTTSGTINPKIQLVDSTGTVVTANGTCCGATDLEVNQVQLNAGGTYTVLISDSYNANTGDYVVFVERMDDPPGAIDLPFDQVVTGNIGSAAQANAYTFSAEANDVVNFTVVTTSGKVNPSIQLVSSTGTVVKAQGTCCGATDLEMNQVVIPTSGAYAVLIKDSYDTNTGNYVIFMQRTNNPAGALDVLFDQVQSGQIGSAAQSNAYTFGGTANDVVSFTVMTTSGSINPSVQLLNPSGTVLNAVGTCCGVTQAQMNSVRIPTSGTYVVLIKDSHDTNTGNYNLSAECFGVCLLPAPTLTSISPTGVLAGSPDFTLTVNGTNFVNIAANSVVEWNGNALPTTRVSSTQMTATVRAADVATGGTFPVTVFTPAPGGGTSLAIPFAVNNPVPVGAPDLTITQTRNEPPLTVATATQPALVCVAGTAVPPQLRTEGYTELVGDITLVCTGGQLPAAGTLIPQANIVVNLQGSITSRLIGSGSEALLLIDEPGAIGLGGVGPAETQNLCTTPLTGCQAYVGTVSNAGGTDIGAVYPAGSGTPAPNVYQGVTSGSQVTFFGVPILPPAGNDTSRVYRITNLRVNANGITGGGAGFQSVLAQTSVNNVQVSVTNPLVTVGYIQASFAGSFRNAANSGPVSPVDPYQGNSQTSQLVAILRFSELFGTAFKTRVNGGFIYPETVQGYPAAIQNIPGAIYNTESGFISSFNGAPLQDTVGANTYTAGLADYGTRLKAVFSNIPSGMSVYVSTVNLIGTNGTTPATGLSPDYAFLVNTESGIDPVTPTLDGEWQLPTNTTTPMAVWEVAQTLPSAVENYDFGVYVTFNNANVTTPGISVALSYAPTPTAPFSASAAGQASNSLGIPRFALAPTSGGIPFTSGYPVPTLASLSPTSAGAGGSAFTLTVNGSNFVDGSVVNWNTNSLATTYVSATQLTASVPATLIASAGIATVTVVNPGAVASGGVGFTIQSGPAATTVSPGAGNGANQTFTFTFSDPAGYQNLGVLDVLINNYLDGIQACYVALVPSGANAGAVYLVDDGGDAGGPFAGYMTLPGSGSVSNSQCTVNGTGSSVVGSGTTITLALNISFSVSFTGNRIFYTAARDTGTGNSGWQALSTWQVPGATATPTQATGVTPASGSGAGQSFVFTFADSAGWQDLGVVDVLFNNFIDGIQGCYIAYSVPAATLYLVDDGGDAGGPFAGYLALPGTGSMSNSQCTVSGVGSSASGSGNTLTLTLNVSFSSSFEGNRIFYTAAGNAAGTENSGWNALGAWTVP